MASTGDLHPERSWADLLPVAGELEPRQLDLATVTHSSGLRFLAAQPSVRAVGARLGQIRPQRHVHESGAQSRWGIGRNVLRRLGRADLLADSDTVLAVNSYVTNVNCSGVGYSARVDVPAVLSWINGPH